MPNKKRKLNPHEAMIAEQMRKQGKTLGQVARYFGVNKPSILKGLNLWKIQGDDLVNKIMSEKLPEGVKISNIQVERPNEN
jgi:lambda repressor-like predicted transcriptional regulator